MSKNLTYVEGTSETLWCMLKSQEIRSTFYTEKTLHKLLFKPKDQFVTNVSRSRSSLYIFSKCCHT